jgi:hypothetical protein
LLASSYGWAKNDILETVYLDELPIFSRLITRRKINDYKMQLAIATNPHTKDAKRLWNTLEQQERQNEGKSYIDSEFDAVGFEKLKQALQNNSSSIAVKS